nr:26 kDa periplasmic immunogenic protein precursor [Candidatus Pantoea persica]
MNNPESYKAQARKAAIDNATQQAAALAEGFNANLGPVYSIRYHVANYQPMPMARMYKAEAASADTSAQQTYEQQSIHFDDQMDVVFDIKPNTTTTQ